MSTNTNLHEVAITAIIVKEGKYLITRRAASKKRFPGKWTVPGGKLETKDYLALPKDTEHYWYNVLERTLSREVEEEVGLTIQNVEYLTSLATVHGDGNPSLVISCIADWRDGEVALDPSESAAFAWITVEEAKKYDLIDGIYDELVMAEQHRLGKRSSWTRGAVI